MDIAEETLNVPARPDHVPVKFWDADTGSIRIDALLKSYQELERKLSTPPDPETEKARARTLLGVPTAVDDYCIRCDHGLFEPDGEINQRLFAAGFTPDQAQLLYDLAAERMLPLVQDMAASFEADRELEKLVAHFGGAEPWRTLSGQILAWAERNLPPPLVAALAGTSDGVMALHRMMQGGQDEPRPLRASSDGGDVMGDLNRMIGDPRYWRDRDPAFIARVTEGFKRAYGG